MPRWTPLLVGISLIFSLAPALSAKQNSDDPEVATTREKIETKLPLEISDRTKKINPDDPSTIAQSEAELKLKRLRRAKESPRLKAMRQRSLSLLTELKQRKLQIHSGKLDPYSGMRKERHDIIKARDAIRGNLAKLNATDDPKIRTQLKAAISTALQPIGRWLLPAEAQDFEHHLTRTQAAELDKLMAIDRSSATADFSLNKLNLMSLNTPEQIYTLIGMPVIISISASPGSKIYIENSTGGRFENNLPIQQITADKSGFATVTWISQGYSIGSSPFLITSPDCHNDLSLNVDVVGLKLMKLPSLDDMRKTAASAENAAKFHSANPSRLEKLAPPSTKP